MNRDITAQFQEKNLEILKNKLKLDINNNMETLTLSLSHILDLEVSSASSKFATIYLDFSETFKDGVQDQLLISLGEKYLEVTKQYLKEKRSDLQECVEKMQLDDGIDVYCGYIDEMEEDFSTYLKDQLFVYIEKELITKISKLNKKYIVEEKQEFILERVLNFLKETLVRRMVAKTVEQMEMRNQTLVNNAHDNYAHYIDIVKKTEL